MIEEIKRWLINVSNELCSETVDTAGTICDETRKANAQFVKEFMGVSNICLNYQRSNYQR